MRLPLARIPGKEREDEEEKERERETERERQEGRFWLSDKKNSL